MTARLAMLHPTTLVGRDLRAALEQQPALWTELALFSTDEDEIGTVAEIRGAPGLVQPLERDSLEGIDLVFFCGALDSTTPLLEEVPAGTTSLVLSADAGTDVGSPLVAGVNQERVAAGGVLVSPHPAALLLSHLLRSLERLQPREVVATLVQPASTYGEPGLDELLDQTRHILAMAGERPPQLFGDQLAFNLLPTTGEATERIVGLLHAVLSQQLPISLQILQGAVFHGIAASLFVRLAAEPGAEAVHKALRQDPWLKLAGKNKLPGPIDAAGRGEILLTRVRQDTAFKDGYWLWAVMDNLICTARNAVAITEALLAPKM